MIHKIEHVVVANYLLGQHVLEDQKDRESPAQRGLLPGPASPSLLPELLLDPLLLRPSVMRV